MLDVVATTPSSPLGACRLVTLDMAPRWRCGWKYVARLRKKGAAGQLSFIRQSGGSFQGARSLWKCPNLKSLPHRMGEGGLPDGGRQNKEPPRTMATGSSHWWRSSYINGRARDVDPNPKTAP